MSQEETPFYCEFNFSTKTCNIVDWMDGQLNYYMNEKYGSEANNTIRIPSKVLFRGKYFEVVGFYSIYEEKVLTFNESFTEQTKVIEFDINLTNVSYKNGLKIYNLDNLVEILNFPSIETSCGSFKTLTNITFNPNYNLTTLPWLQNNISLTTIKIPNSITTIQSFIFNGCNNLEFIENPNSVTTIEPYAFRDTKIAYNQIPERFYQTTIPGGLFIGVNMTGFSIPETVTEIGSCAFYNNQTLPDTLTIPDSVTSIGYSAFFNANFDWRKIPTRLYDQVIPTGLFAGMDMTGFSIPSTVKVIEPGVFPSARDTNEINSFTVPATVDIIGDFAFYKSTYNTIAIEEVCKKLDTKLLQD